MKIQISLIVRIFVLAIAFFSCKKETTSSTGTKPAVNYLVNVKLKLEGDISIKSEDFSAREIDNDIYGVSVLDENGNEFAQGLFTNLDSINIPLVKNIRYKFKVVVLKKGSGLGIYTINRSGDMYIGAPIRKNLDNKFYFANDTSQRSYVSKGYLDTLTYLPVSGPPEKVIMPEVDSYYGSSDFIATDTGNTLLVNLKRLSFGIQFNVINYYGGILVPDYNNTMEFHDVKSAGLQPVHIYTTDYFRNSDSLTANIIKLKLTWYKNDGTVQVITDGTYLHPKRNQKTVINITLPLPTSKPTINILETDWSSHAELNL